MADIDPALIGQVISAIPYDQAFGAPLAACIDAQTKAANSALNFILNVGFSEDENGVKKTNYAEFQFEDQRPDGSVQTRTLKVPLILLINSPQLEISEGEISFDLEISQSATMKDRVTVDAELEAKVGWGPFSVGLKARSSYDKERTRKTDTRAKQHILMKVKQAEPPEAINLLLETMREACLGSNSGESIEALTGGTPAAIPAPVTAPGSNT